MTNKMKLLSFFLQLFLPVDQISDTFNHLIHEGYFILAHTVHIRDIPDSVILCSGSKPTGSTGLQTAVGAPLLEIGLLRCVWNLNHHRCTEARSAIGRARENISVHLGNFKFATDTLASRLYRLHKICETIKHGTNVVSLFHTDDTQMIFFVDPYQGCLRIVVVDTAGMRPIPLHTPRQEHRFVWLLEQEMILNQTLFSRLVDAVRLR